MGFHPGYACCIPRIIRRTFPDPDMRLFAVYLLADIGGNGMRQRLSRLAADRDFTVSEFAKQELKHL
jgi:hypothetical protein